MHQLIFGEFVATTKKKASKPAYVARDLVYSYLKKSMQNGDILPGNSLDLNEVSEHLQISRTPLRDALIRLEAEVIVQEASVAQQAVVLHCLDLIVLVRRAARLGAAVDVEHLPHLLNQLQQSTAQVSRP